MGLPLSAAAGDGAALDSATARMSEARISPPAPEPRTSARLTPRSLARRRALGEILTGWAVDGAGDGAGVTGRFADAAVGIEEAAGTAGGFFSGAVADFYPCAATPGRPTPC